MNRMLKFIAAALLAATSAQGAAAIKDDSFKDASGARVLREWVVVDAGQADVWPRSRPTTGS